ncbi:hypothetical protein D9611_006034 [Ephemerocybe angulata]|uniref:Protein kinase domain-containing protein n=1 Tax=Ephemerocybe angulata TaxID=980116 RepID=A0A8H5CGP5_9AGAR|nr:hypothetical protein D9611_006034 [Tulosesus angulatus]
MRGITPISPAYRYQTRSRTQATLAVPVVPPNPEAPNRTRTQKRVTTNQIKTTRSQAKTERHLPAPRIRKPRTNRRRQHHASLATIQPALQPQHGPVVVTPSVMERKDPGEAASDAHTVDAEWAASLYRDLVPTTTIDSFLDDRASGFRRGRKCAGRWTTLVRNPRRSDGFQLSVFALISNIITKLCPPGAAGVIREATIAQLADPTQASNEGAAADIFIRAAGPSFELPLDGGPVGYSNIASVIDVKAGPNVLGKLDATLIAGVTAHSEHIFTHQPNRNFVRSLIITESNVRLVHFDRSGAYVTSPINIHEHPTTFVQLVLGVASTDEDTLGLDTTVQWVTNPTTGRKSSGTVKTVDDRGRDTVYELRVDVPPFVRPSIAGRGTTCWHAVHPITGKKVIIKDAWRTADQTPESEYLTAARGIDGIVQMLSYQDFCAQTKDFWPKYRSKSPCNRVKLRIVEEFYGSNVSDFTTAAQFVAALKDAISAHAELLRKRRVLHRDISIQNILFMDMDSNDHEGRRSVLIDFDMAVWVSQGISTNVVDARKGTRMYQSIAALRSTDSNNQPPPLHTYLDDLESFFYVACHIMFGFSEPGESVPRTPPFLVDWDTPRERDAAAHKECFVRDPFPSRSFPPFWGNACETLLSKFHDFVRDIIIEKSRIRNAGLSVEERDRELQDMMSDMDAHYARLDELFQKALQDMEVQGPSTEDRTRTPIPKPTSLPRPADGVGRGLKRYSDELDAEVTPRKRHRTNVDHP